MILYFSSIIYFKKIIKILSKNFQGVADIFTRVVTAIETDDDQPTKDKEKCVIS